jgi:hypothetical protein
MLQAENELQTKNAGLLAKERNKATGLNTAYVEVLGALVSVRRVGDDELVHTAIDSIRHHKACLDVP